MLVRTSALDGVPATARDRANRSRLVELKGQLDAERQRLDAKGGQLSQAEASRLADINAKLDGIKTIEDRLRPPKPPQQPAFLLGIDTAVNGRTIVAIGNSDTAANICTYVPAPRHTANTGITGPPRSEAWGGSLPANPPSDPRPPAAVIAACVALVAALASCGPEQEVPMNNTITQQQANERVERYVQDAASTLPTSVRLELAASQEALDCSDPTDGGPRGRVTASRGYWLRDLPREQNAEHINALVQWWKDHGFVVLTDSRPKDNYVWVENPADSFRMSIQETVDDPRQLTLGATSPCVWPNGSPAPKPN